MSVVTLYNGWQKKLFSFNFTEKQPVIIFTVVIASGL
jgi:hypothetical protein